MTHQVIEKLREHWARIGAGEHLGEGASEEHISKRELENKCVFPSDYREYLKSLDGFKAGWRDPEGFRFWPLVELCSIEVCGIEQDIPNDGRARIVFADYLDLSWAYALDCVDGRVYMVGASSGVLEPVANSFFDFIEYYLTGSDCLYPS